MSESEVSARLNELIGLDPSQEESNRIICSILPQYRKLEAQEAQTFVDAIDRAMSTIREDASLYGRCLRVLRKLCGSREILPSSHFLSDGLVKLGEDPVAHGGSAEVWEGTYEERKVAIKRLRCSNNYLAQIKKSFYKEVVLWKQLSHPNIVPFLGVSHSSSLQFCMTSEWMQFGDMTKYVGNFPQTNRPLLLVDVCKGLQYLHSLNIIHGDLKGANILIDSDRHARLSDFGLISIISDTNSMDSSMLTFHTRGTIRWMAPELLNADEDSNSRVVPSTASDMYSLAMVIVELFSDKIPFSELKKNAVITKVTRGGRPQRPTNALELGLSDAIWELATMCWNHEQDKRPDISRVLYRLRAVVSGIQLPERLADFDPRSETSVDVLRTILSGLMDEFSIPDLTDEHTRYFIEVLDKATTSIYVGPELHLRYLSVIGMIYCRTGHLPKSYLLSKGCVKSTDGPFGSGRTDVWKGTYDNHIVAVKTPGASSRSDMHRIRKQIFERAAVSKWLSNPNIVPFLGVSNSLPPSMVYQWMSRGTLTEYLDSDPQANRLRLLIDIGSGLQYLHSLNIVHRNLRAAHVLINDAKQACLTGFMTPSFINDQNQNSSTHPPVSHESYRWMAPEVLSSQAVGVKFSPASDIYALSMVFIEAFTGHVPFHGLQDEAVPNSIRNGSRPERPKQVQQLGLTDDIWKLIQMCWKPDRDNRPTISSVLQSLRKVAPGLSFLEQEGLVSFDPSSEIDVKALRSVLDSPVHMNMISSQEEPMFINVLDQAISSTYSDPLLIQNCLHTLSQLWVQKRLLPSQCKRLEGFEIQGDKPAHSRQYSKIWKGQYGARAVAVKDYKPSSFMADKMFFNDIMIWKRLSHPNILPMLGVSDELKKRVVSPWMIEGNIKEYVSSDPEVNRVRLLIDVSKGLQYLHSLNIVHGDLKGTHILVNELNQACLFGFGLSVIRDPKSRNSTPDPINAGTFRWAAPELLDAQRGTFDANKRSTASDVYAFAMVIIEIYTGEVPFAKPKLSKIEVISLVVEGGRPERPNQVDSGPALSDDMWELTKLCWHQNPCERPTISMVLKRLEKTPYVGQIGSLFDLVEDLSVASILHQDESDASLVDQRHGHVALSALRNMFSRFHG